ncbi:hypothetical protein B0T26DRAFT_805480 [Lasiosphaeria miniovina]|uniref:Uncharacterized protein n=1 Tax=Lasiosphaeria miniovina TaxID=1954250 RepID=A0AA40DQL6_9PEZI|nr:uncharacterized protein B0T26DRAFT_805480 [Lasiosphaeria miniovina]KAK0709851.1 hypothetical protein B0T26DRAFT_805480 [Lasiosphaeria miniovina]
MVSIRGVFTSAVALLAVPALAAVTPAELVKNLHLLTQQSKALQGPAQSINLVNTPLILIGQGPYPIVIAGLNNMTQTATADISTMQGSAPVTASPDAVAIAGAFRNFVQTHVGLLKILTGKAGLLDRIPIGEPVVQTLEANQNVLDAGGLSPVDSIQSAADRNQIAADRKSLESAFQAAISAYRGIAGPTKRHVRDLSA